MFKFVEGLPFEGCIYHCQSFQNIFAKIHQGTYKCLRIQTEEKISLFLPLILRKVSEDFYEAFSCYGYGGIITDHINNNNFIDVEALKNFLNKNKIHSLFLRHTPFISNYKFWPPEFLSLNRITYEAELLLEIKNFQSYKKQLPQKIRASVNHAEKKNLFVEVVKEPMLDNSLKVFYEIYISRMKSLKLSNFFYFDFDFFKKHFHVFGDRCKLIIVKQKNSDKICAGALFLCDFHLSTVHYHLSASSIYGLKHQANELLIAYSKFYFGINNFKVMQLGGGAKIDESDGLSRFKKKFSDNSNPFYISRLISNERRYFEDRNSAKLNNKDLFLIGDAII